MDNIPPKPPKQNKQSVKVKESKSEPESSAQSVTVKAGIVAVRKWMDSDSK